MSQAPALVSVRSSAAVAVRPLGPAFIAKLRVYDAGASQALEADHGAREFAALKEAESAIEQAVSVEQLMAAASTHAEACRQLNEERHASGAEWIERSIQRLTALASGDRLKSCARIFIRLHIESLRASYAFRFGH